MPDPVVPDRTRLVRDGHVTMLKWHRGRARPADLAFGPVRILEGLGLGASVEIDLVHHAGGGFAVLHDAVLERSTTGTGRVDATDADTLRALHLRDDDGAVTQDRVMLLCHLCARIAEEGAHPDAVLQLDMKETAETLTEADVAAFAHDVAPVSRHMILSGGDAAAVARLAAAVPGLAVGHDPCLGPMIDDLRETLDFGAFVAGALAAAPDASMIYLAHELLIWAADMGVDLVAPFHAAGKRVDAWTIAGSGAEATRIVPILLRLKVDQITTDDAIGMAARFGWRNPSSSQPCTSGEPARIPRPGA